MEKGKIEKDLKIVDAADDGEQFIWDLWVQERILPVLEGGQCPSWFGHCKIPSGTVLTAISLKLVN